MVLDLGLPREFFLIERGVPSWSGSQSNRGARGRGVIRAGRVDVSRVKEFVDLGMTAARLWRGSVLTLGSNVM